MKRNGRLGAKHGFSRIVLDAGYRSILISFLLLTYALFGVESPKASTKKDGSIMCKTHDEGP